MILQHLIICNVNYSGEIWIFEQITLKVENDVDLLQKELDQARKEVQEKDLCISRLLDQARKELEDKESHIIKLQDALNEQFQLNKNIKKVDTRPPKRILSMMHTS